MDEKTPGALRDEDFQEVFRGEAGERVLRHLMDTYGIWQSTIVPGDPMSSAFNEGQRSVVLGILERVRRKWTPAEFADEVTQAQVDYRAQTFTGLP